MVSHNDDPHNGRVDDDELLDQAIAEFLRAESAGRAGEIQQWLDRYPNCAAALLEFFKDRQQINRQITLELNQRFGLNLTDAFCGFKAYRRAALAKLRITETGWGMPLQLWVQAAYLGLRLKEIGVPRVYLDPNRAFGGVLNDAAARIAYYRKIIDDAERDVKGWAQSAKEETPQASCLDYGWCEEMCW